MLTVKNPVTPPPIYIEAMNKLMLRLAGSHCEGVHIHALHTRKYSEEIALPELAVGWQHSGKRREDVTLASTLFVVPTDEASYAAWAEMHVRQQISFYLSTPAYRLISELHGWDKAALLLSPAAVTGNGSRCPLLASDEMRDPLAIFGTWAELPGKINAKYGQLLDRVSYYLPYLPGGKDPRWRP